MDARQILDSLVGSTIPTMAGRRNRVIAIRGEDVIVATDRSPRGKPIPIAWIQEAMDRLERDGELEISVASVGYRSAFVGAVLQTLPGTAALMRPRRVILRTQGERRGT